MIETTTEPDAITHWLFDHKQVFIDKLKELVEIESPSTEPESNHNAFNFVEKEFHRLGYQSTHYSGNKTGGFLVASSQNRTKNCPIQLLIGHCDTVWPLGTLDEMPCKIDGNSMYGPGIYDMKAGLMEIIFGLDALQKLALTPSVTPVVVITSDEETGSFESRTAINRLAAIAERSYVLEPSLGFDAKIKTSRKGVGMFDITIRGVSAHSGLEPEKGASAIMEMTNIINQLYQLNDPEKGTTVNVGTIEGGERTNVIAAKAKISVDVRVQKKEESKKIERLINNLKTSNERFKIKIEGGIDRPPMIKNRANKKLWKITKALGKTIGLDLSDGMSGGASDGNLTSQFCATLDGLGAVGDGAHALHEHILIDETLKRTALLALLIMEPSISD